MKRKHILRLAHLAGLLVQSRAVRAKRAPQMRKPRLTSLLAPYPGEELEAYEVSKLINNAAVDTPDCFEPAVPPPPPSLFSD